ncbi:MAG: mechanosensitive ion channel domain-containing protein [Mucilaginibacter sp.]|uniref:mechanosensitive ion channel family protein n=1 Tax=Mucilaginibacter sp. TaxID=1882438 RepID=UPI0032679771
MRNLFKLLSFGLLTLLLITAIHDSSAQDKNKRAPARSRRDSIRRELLQRKSLIRSFHRTGDADLDNLLGKIEDYTSQYIQNNSDLSKGFDTLEISQRLPSLEKRMGIMKKTIDNSTTLVYLVTIRNMVDRVTDQTKSWAKKLSKYSDQLDTLNADVTSFQQDTIISYAPEDPFVQRKYVLQVQDLQAKWRKLDSCVKKSIIRIGYLQNSISSLSILMIDLDDKVDIKISQFTVKSIDNEYGFIWDMHPQKNPIDTAVAKTYNLNSRLVKYFFPSKSNYWSHLAFIFLLILFFAWIFNSKRKIRRIKDEDAAKIFAQTRYIVKTPYTATLAVASILGLYFYDHPPQVIIQFMLVITTACIGLLIRNNWPKPLFKFGVVLFVLVIIFGISSLFIEITHLNRIVLLLSSAAAIYFSFKFLPFLKAKPEEYPPFMELIVKVFIALHAISILLNIAGRFSIAQIIGCTTVFNLSLAMGMYLLVQILMESLFLQLEGNKTENQEIISYLDFKVLQKKFKDVAIKIAFVLWLFALCRNLVIDDYIYDQANDFLTHPYKFSSTAFTFGSVLIFMIVIWMSGIIARLISYFYDFAGQQTKLTLQAKKTRSSILLIRLTVFVIGFFVAISAAGIPMDKVTIVIGALGVGIGFGLQNIVNNLVSGVILAFEKPVQVGDIIEVSGKSGTITEIGIRSSKIDCGNGSELIVPNGDLISQHVVNWTLTNNNRQIELTIGVAYGSDVKKIEDILKDIVNNHDDIMKTPAPGVYLNNFGETAITFKIQFWAEEIGKYTSLKSKILSEIYIKFAQEGIEIPNQKNDIQVNFPEGSRLITDSNPVIPPVKESPSDQDQ